MESPKVGQVQWLIRKRHKGHEAIGFVIDKDNFGCVLIGSPKGSYLTGHGERWQSKWAELKTEGYLPEKEAKEKKIIPLNWKPPRIKRTDKEVIDIVRTLKRRENRK